MKTTTYTISDILKRVEEMRKIVEKESPKGLIIEFYRNMQPDEPLSYYRNITSKDKNKRDEVDIVASFNQIINEILSDPKFCSFSCEIKRSNGNILQKAIPIPLINGHVHSYGSSSTGTDSESDEHQALPTQTTRSSAVKNVLGMMGFDKNSLNGFDDDEFGGFGAIMQVRENLLEKRFIQADKDRRYDEMVAEKAKLESKLEAVQKELDKANKDNEDLEDRIDELESEIEELEHLKPEYSIGGMSLVGILEKTATNLAIKHADVLGGLAGVSKEEMVSMLQNPQDGQQPIPQQATEDANVQVSPVSPRSQYIDAIGQFVDSLGDDEFNEFWNVMQAFAKDKTLINKTLTTIGNE